MAGPPRRARVTPKTTGGAAGRGLASSAGGLAAGGGSGWPGLVVVRGGLCGGDVDRLHDLAIHRLILLVRVQPDDVAVAGATVDEVRLVVVCERVHLVVAGAAELAICA